jgi:xanthine/uracil permease
VAVVVILVTLGLKFFTRGMLSVSAVLIGLSPATRWRF